jgi:hypothetical protein
MAGTFQQSINYDFAFGVVGEIMRDGPLRAHVGYLNSASAANNVFGRVFTLNADGKTVGAGGTGAIWGILSNPKQHVSMGTTAGPLAPTFALPNNVVADFVEFAKIVVALGGTKAATPGLQLQFAQADGQISVPAAAGTPDAGNTLFNCYVEDYPQPAEANNQLLVRIQL